MDNLLHKLRNNTNCRLWELAAKSGVSASTICAIEKYDYKPQLTTMQRIATSLNLEAKDIWPALVIAPDKKNHNGGIQ
jgi:DNA-binding XRE family transcriptional regulator